MSTGSFRDRMDSIMRADEQRRRERELTELLRLYGPTLDYAHSRNLTGQPSEPNRTHRASRNSWNRGMRGRTWGIAASLETGIVGSAVRGSYTRTVDGVTTVIEPEPVTRTRTARATDDTEAQERQNRIDRATAHIELAPIQDYSQDS